MGIKNAEFHADYKFFGAFLQLFQQIWNQHEILGFLIF